MKAPAPATTAVALPATHPAGKPPLKKAAAAKALAMLTATARVAPRPPGTVKAPAMARSWSGPGPGPRGQQAREASPSGAIERLGLASARPPKRGDRGSGQEREPGVSPGSNGHGAGPSEPGNGHFGEAYEATPGDRDADPRRRWAASSPERNYWGRSVFKIE